MESLLKIPSLVWGCFKEESEVLILDHSLGDMFAWSRMLCLCRAEGNGAGCGLSVRVLFHLPCGPWWIVAALPQEKLA